MLGRVLGDRYRVLSRLGEGGMGTVYLCEHAVLRRRFALKVLRPELSGDRELVERFRNEAIAASGIGQENVVDVVDFGREEDGALYFVMEALEGRSLATVLREEGPLVPSRALALLEQVCRALAAVHGTGVVHRDVKPENVFVERAGRRGPSGEEVERAKVLDFGISHVPTERGGDRLTRAGSIIGTPEYMAPEQATGEGCDHRADVYAVGVIAYEILTGSLPIEGATPIATLVAAQMRAPEPPSRRRPGLPQQVDAVVLRALAKRPQDRFGSMDELAGELARVRAELCAAGESRSAAVTSLHAVRPRPSGPRDETVVAIPRAARPRGLRSALLVAVGALGVAIVLAAGAAGYWARGGEGAAAPALRVERSPVAPVGDPAGVAPERNAVHPERSSDVLSVHPARSPDVISLHPGRSSEISSVHPERSSGARVSERSRRAASARTPPHSPEAAPAAEPGLHDPYAVGADLKPDPFE